MTKQDIQKNPINFLYAFSNTNFEALVKKYISAKAAKTIAAKRVNQIAYLQILYGGANKREEALTDVQTAIMAQYALTPQQILNKLLAGETVAGKNWQQGVFGIGQTKGTTYADNADLKVDKTTGKVYNSAGEELKGTIAPLYQNDEKGNTYISGYYYATEEGKAYTTKRAADGKYYAYTYGTSEGMYAADGSSVEAADFASVWDNIATALPFIEKLLNWIASLVQSFVPISTKNTIPAQTEFISNTDSDIDIASVGILGAVALGSFLLIGANKKK